MYHLVFDYEQKRKKLKCIWTDDFQKLKGAQFKGIFFTMTEFYLLIPW